MSNEPTVETIASAETWETIVDGVNEVGTYREAVLEFDVGGLSVGVKDGADVGMIDQRVEDDDFEHFDVDDEFRSGIDTERLEDLLKAVDDDVIKFSWDWDSFRWHLHADGVDAHISGIEVDYVNGSPQRSPPLKDDLNYNVDVTIPTDKFKRATKIVDMASSQATFRMGGEDGIFDVVGKGDTDEYTVSMDDEDDFEWREDPPDDVAEMRVSNDIMKNIPKVLDEDTVRFVAGPSLPYHIWTRRKGGVETKIVQAPYIDDS